MAFTPSPERKKKIDEILTRYPTKRAACIPVLHVCQGELGWVSPEVIAYVADLCGIATSEVQGVVTFYTMFHQKPVAKHVVWVCRTLSCDLMGGKAIQDHLEKRLGCHVGETSANGQYSLKKAECLAGCGYAPMVQIDDNFYEALTPAKLDAILDKVDRAETPAQLETPWYQTAAKPTAGTPTPSTPPGGAPGAPTPSTPPTR